MNVFDRVEMIDEGIHEVHGKKFIFFEFESRVNGTRQQEGMQDPVLRYTYIQYLIEPGKALVFSFNCHEAAKRGMAGDGPGNDEKHKSKMIPSGK